MRVNNYMAILRNIRNILDVKVSDKHFNKIVKAIQDEKAVLNSKQLPFRWFSAYREIEGNDNPKTGKLLDALQDAIEISVKNVPKLKGVTFSSADNSGSMSSPLSQKSKVQYCDVANIMQAILSHASEDVVTSVFAEDFKIVNISKRDGIISNMQKFQKTPVGYATYGYKAIKHLVDNKIKVDRIVIFSDMQTYNEERNSWNKDNESMAAEFKKYKRQVNPNVYLYSIDLAGYGVSIMPQDEPNVALIAGWSENVFKFIQIFESDKKQAVEMIQKN